MRKKDLHLAVPVMLVLLAYALRVQHIVDFLEWGDEIWSVWHIQGTLSDVLVRTAHDWPPLFGLLNWAWVQLAGPTLEVSRFLLVLTGTLSAALVYRAALALGGLARLEQARTAAWLSTLALAVMPYSIFAGVDVRAYGLLLALGALALWLTVRWLRRPSLRRGLVVAAALAALMYTSYTSAAYLALLTLLVLALHPRLLARWLGVLAGTALLLLPLLPRFLTAAPSRFVGGSPVSEPLASFPQALSSIYIGFGGTPVVALGLAAAGLILVLLALTRPARRRVALVLLVWVLFPALLYWAVQNTTFMQPRYMWWVALGLALAVGSAAAHMPRPGRLIAAAALLLVPFLPVDYTVYGETGGYSPPFRAAFGWLSERLRPGDVLVIDPQCQCGWPQGWAYFVPQYFPSGYLPIVETPGDAARVWYLATEGWPQDEALRADVERGRTPGVFFGPWNFLLRLYEGPPSWEGVPFGSTIRFHGAEIVGNHTVVRENDTLDVRLWWSAAAAPGVDYSFSVAVLDRQGQIVTQADGPVKHPDTPEQTSLWVPGVYYQDSRTLHLPPDLHDGSGYRLVVTVYQWWDGVRLQPEPNDQWPAGDGYLELQRLTVVSW